MLMNQGYQKMSIPQYVEALIKCVERKVCTNLSKAVNATRDVIYRGFERQTQSNTNTKDSLKTLAKSHLDQEAITLVLDDCLVTKIYAEQIEGIELSFDGSTGRPCVGIRIVTALLTDTKLSIPIDAVPYVGKALARSSYKSKTNIGIDIIKETLKSLSIKRFIADAHYSTKEMLIFLKQERIDFLMKITRRRVVSIGDKKGQLQNILRLKKNQHFCVAVGILDEKEYYFYAVKIKNGTIVYFISSDYIDKNELLEMYRIRWNIELFHRTAKQSFGLSECQMRSIEKQRQHALNVMHAYAYSSVHAKLQRLSSVEAFVRAVRDVKTAPYSKGKFRSKQDFDLYA